MAYTINKTDNTEIATVEDGAIDTTTSITLVGRNVTNYGDALNENFIHILENFANGTMPRQPLNGQLWFDTSDDSNVLKIRDGNAWKQLGSLVSQASAPPTTNATNPGDLWWDSTNHQLHGYSGSEWILIGPPEATGSTVSRVIVETITDDASPSVDHVCMKLVLEDESIAIISKTNYGFTPATAISGFDTINPGINMKQDADDETAGISSTNKFYGSATNADKLGNRLATQYVNTETSSTQTINSGLNISDDTEGLVIGTDNDLQLSISGDNAIIRNTRRDGDLELNVNRNGTQTTALVINGNTGRISLANDPVGLLDISTKGYVDGLASNYLKTREASSTSGPLTITNATEGALAINDRLNLGSDGDHAIIKNIRSNGDILFRISDGGTINTPMRIDGSASKVLLSSHPVTNDNPLTVATKEYVDNVRPRHILLTNDTGIQDMNGGLRIRDDSGLAVGSSSDLTLTVSDIHASIRNVIPNGNLILSTNAGGEVQVSSDPTSDTGVVRKGYLDDKFTNTDFNEFGSNVGITLPIGTTAERALVTKVGSGYTSVPTVSITPIGSGATATATISGGVITEIRVISGGSGYLVAPNVTITGGAGATATATISGGRVTGISIVNGGSGFTTPVVTISSGSGATATATILNGAVSGITVNNGGSGYRSIPNVSITGGGGSGAAAEAVLTNGVVSAINIVPERGIIRMNSETGHLETLLDGNVSRTDKWEEVVTSKGSQLNVTNINNSTWYQWHGDILWQGGRVMPDVQNMISGEITITLPIPFPNNILSINVSVINELLLGNSGVTIIRTPAPPGQTGPGTIGTSSFKFHPNNADDGYMWTAIGY